MHKGGGFDFIELLSILDLSYNNFTKHFCIITINPCEILGDINKNKVTGLWHVLYGIRTAVVLNISILLVSVCTVAPEQKRPFLLPFCCLNYLI